MVLSVALSVGRVSPCKTRQSANKPGQRESQPAKHSALTMRNWCPMLSLIALSLTFTLCVCSPIPLIHSLSLTHSLVSLAPLFCCAQRPLKNKAHICAHRAIYFCLFPPYHHPPSTIHHPLSTLSSSIFFFFLFFFLFFSIISPPPIQLHFILGFQPTPETRSWCKHPSPFHKPPPPSSTSSATVTQQERKKKQKHNDIP